MNATQLDAETGVYLARQGRVSYGVSIGILCLECDVPFVPGDVGNASTYDFPVSYELVRQASCQSVIVDKDPELAPFFVEAAERLESQGVRAITGDCGYMATYQDAVAAEIDVPVFLSSLIQIPLVLKMLRPDQSLAIICANDGAFADSLLDGAGVSVAERERLVVKGLQEHRYWRETIIDEAGRLDLKGVEGEVVETALQLRVENPQIGAFFFECSDLPPYSAAVQAATGLPVFDWIAFINYVHHAVVSPGYRGFH